jgi:flagellar hook-associated protein 3 FlgL
MRISDQQIADTLKYQMNASYDQLSQAELVLSSQKKLNTPADNPVGTGVVLNLQAQLAQNAQFQTTATDTQSWLQTTEQALSGVNDILVQARTLAVQGANDTMTLDARQTLGAQVGQLIQQAVQTANASYEGRYVLSGQQTSTVPFVANSQSGATTVTYQGDEAPMQREVGPGQMMQVNTPGGSALSTVFSALTTLQQDLQSGSASAVSGDLQTIDQAHSSLLLTQTVVGSRVNQIQAVQTSLQNLSQSMTQQSSQITDADLAQATIDFSTRQATYQAVLAAAGKMTPASLLDFLK